MTTEQRFQVGDHVTDQYGIECVVIEVVWMPFYRLQYENGTQRLREDYCVYPPYNQESEKHDG